MMCDFNRTFNPTSEQKREDEERLNKITTQACEEKWCCTCKNYISVDAKTPGVVTAFPECKLGGLAVNTCDHYESDLISSADNFDVRR